MSCSSSLSCGSSLTSVNGLLGVPKPSMDSRTMGDGLEASDELELGKRVWPRAENVGDVGDGKSDDIDDCEFRGACPMAVESGESRWSSSSCFLAASTRLGNCRSINPRGIVENGKSDGG